MLKIITGLPAQILGVYAEGKVTSDDYENVVAPLLEKERQLGNRIRFLYQFGPEFSNLTSGAAFEDFRIGLRYLRLFERCAIVTDIDWIHRAAQISTSFMPCLTRTFRNDQLQDAVDWLVTAASESKLTFELRSDGVLIVKPNGPLRSEDFDKLASVVDPWLETHHELRGVVICVKHFPGWENVGSFIHHIDFVSAHHKKVKRVALAVDGVVPELMAKAANHFVAAEIKQFPYEQKETAIKWAADNKNSSRPDRVTEASMESFPASDSPAW